LPPARSTSELIARAIQRDPEAFSELYVQNWGKVFRHIYSIIGRQHEAEDLTSETFLRAWNAIGRFEDRGLAIEAWIVKIAHNVAVAHLRRRRESATIDDVVLEANPKDGPAVVTEGLAEGAALAEAIRSLPAMQRQVILLRFVEERSYEEVGAIVGRTQGAVRVIQFRALRSLKRLLRNVLFPEGSRDAIICAAERSRT
jgi:RNA polymerase sigma-70 factor (ECF subfamily)